MQFFPKPAFLVKIMHTILEMLQQTSKHTKMQVSKTFKSVTFSQ